MIKKILTYSGFILLMKAFETVPLSSSDGCAQLARQYLDSLKYEKIVEMYRNSNDCESEDDEKVRLSVFLYEYEIANEKVLLKDIVSEFRKISKQNPNDPTTLFLNGIIERHKKNFKRADSLYNCIFEKDSSFSGFMFFNIWMEKGVLLKNQKKYNEAIKCFSRANTLSLNDCWVWIEKAMCLIELGNYNEASDAFYSGLKNLPTERIRQLFNDIQTIITEDERNEWNSLHDRTEQLRFLRIFWKKRDPNLTDNLNEKLIEHYKKLNFLMTYYPSLNRVDPRRFKKIDFRSIDEEFHGASKSGNNENYWSSQNRSFYSNSLDEFLLSGDYRSKWYFTLTPKVPHLTINANFSVFKEDSLSRFDFYYLLPFSELNFVENISNLTIQMKIFDQFYNEISSFETIQRLYADSITQKSHYFVDEIRFKLKPGQYRVSLELKNIQSGKMGVYNFGIEIKNYNHSQLTLSDIQPAVQIENNKSEFLKPNSTLSVLPNPAFLVLRKNPLIVYYEIYNLSLSNDGKSDYEVSFKMKETTERKGLLRFLNRIFSKKSKAITFSTRKSGLSIIEREYIGLDITELAAGNARLEIRVHDLISKQECFSNIDLIIVDENSK